MKTTRQLYASLTVLILVMTVLLIKEVRNFRSITTEQTAEPIISETITPLPPPDPLLVLGNKGAPLTIVEYTDLGNKDAKKLHQEFVAFVRRRPLKAKLVFKSAPVSGIFKDPTLAHQAAFCASRQNCSLSKGDAPEPCIWSFLDSLIENEYSLKEAGLRKAAASTKMNVDKWWSCVNDPSTISAIEKDLNEAMGLKYGEPPIIFLNNRKLGSIKEINIPDLLTTITEE